MGVGTTRMKPQKCPACRGTNRAYIARVRMAGQRSWFLLGNKTTSKSAAVSRVAKAILKQGHWDYGDVALIADYYEPRTVFEMRTR